MVVAYSYMALVPIIQPAVIKCCTTKKERLIRMDYNGKKVSKSVKIFFPIIITVVSGLIAPKSLALVGFLMFGNLIKECGVLGSLADTAKNTLANLITLLLGITIAFKMQAADFLTWETLMIMALGLLAFVFDTVGGIMCAKVMNLFTKKKINPMIGAAGISAFRCPRVSCIKWDLKRTTPIICLCTLSARTFPDRSLRQSSAALSSGWSYKEGKQHGIIIRNFIRGQLDRFLDFDRHTMAGPAGHSNSYRHHYRHHLPYERFIPQKGM